MKLRQNRGKQTCKTQTTATTTTQIDQHQNANDDLDLVDKLRNQFQIKNCFVKLTFMNTEQSAMDETSPAPTEPAKRRGRKPKESLAAKNAATLIKSETADKAKSDEKTEISVETVTEEKKENNETTTEKVEKPPASEKKQTKKEMAEVIIDSGGRSKRTRKPNPKYMDEPMVSATKHLKEDSADSENAEGEDGDDEMQSSDEPRNEGPLKKRMLQKHGIKSGAGRKPGSGKGTPINAGRKSIGTVAAKRKLEVDIDIDDEHGKQLFLDAKRRLTHSPSNSDDDLHLRKGKLTVSDVLAAKLRSKYPGEFTVKRNVTMDSKTISANRVRLLDRGKAGFQKEEIIGSRKRKVTEETETSEDDSMLNKSTSDQEATSPKNNNRRKTQHTKILSDDRVVRASTTGQLIRRGAPGTIIKQINKSPLTQNQLIQSKIQSNAPAKTYSISPHSRIIASNKPAILRPPPRILNSTLCKPANKSTVPSLVTKLVTKDDYEQDVNSKRNNNIISSRSKENNVTSYTYTEKDGKMIPKKTIVQLPQNQQQLKLLQQRRTVLPIVRTQPKQQKIISEPVSMNLTNSRRIRKITCFETWYVIKMAEEHPKPEKSILKMSLMQIGNEIKKIELPSDEWTYKILLQPLSKQLLAMRKTKANETSTETDSKKADSEQKSEETDENKKESKGSVEKTTDGKGKDKKSSDEKQKEEKKSNGEEEEEEEKSEEKSADESDEKKSTEESETSSDEKPTETENAKENKEALTNSENTNNNKHDIYTGEVHDPNINADERHNYRPINIMFRRKCQNPNIRIQFDRTVILKNQTFYLNVDGKNVRLVASPQSIETYDDIKTLLQIINDVSLNSCCVELATHAA